MKVNFHTRKGIVDVVLSDGQGNHACVASLQNYADSNCWMAGDLRLTKYHQVNWSKPGEPIYSGLFNADAYCSRYHPRDQAETDFVKSLLREYTVLASGEIAWASFEGVVKGHPNINGYTPPRWEGFDQTGYFGYQEGMAILNDIKSFWSGFESSTDESEWRIANPNRQPSQSNILSACSIRQAFLVGTIGDSVFKQIMEGGDSVFKQIMEGMDCIIPAVNVCEAVTPNEDNNSPSH